MRITTKGFKAHDLDLELRGLNLVVGPNGSGKSTLAEAVRMVALGYIPSLGKRPVDLAALMRDDTMSVEMALEGGRTIRRTLDRRDTGYTAGSEASWMRMAKPAEVSKAILKVFGDEEQDVAECLDIRQLLAATPNQRAARMEQLLSAGARGGEDIAKDVARLIVMRLAETTEDRMPADYVDALPMVPDKQRAFLFDQAGMLKTKILEAGIQGAIVWANEEKRGAADGLKKKSAAAEELRKRAAQVPEPDERDIIRLENEKKKGLQDLGAIQQAWKDWKLRSETAARINEQLEAVQEIATRTNQLSADAEAVHGKAAAELREQSDKVLEAMSSLKMPAEEDDAPARVLISEAASLVQRADAIDLPHVPDATKEERTVADIQARITIAETSEWGEVLTIAEDIEGVGSTKGFKTAIAKPVKRLRELAHKCLGANPTELKQDLTVAKTKLQEKVAAVEKAQAARDLAGQRRLELTIEADKKTAEARRIKEEITNRRRQALQQFDAKRTELATERQKLEKALATHRAALDNARNEKAAVDRRLTDLQSQARGAGELPPEPQKPESIEQKLRTAEVELAKLYAARATHTEIHTVLDQIEAAKAGAVVFAAIEWALQRQREVEISSAGGPLMRTMTEFLRAAGRKEMPFIRASQGNCAIGWRTDGGREIQVQALSGGEWCLFAAALTSAVILCRKSAVKILLVEAGETDARTLEQLMGGIEGVHGDHMTAVVMTHRAPDRITPAWSMVRVYEDKEAAATAA